LPIPRPFGSSTGTIGGGTRPPSGRSNDAPPVPDAPRLADAARPSLPAGAMASPFGYHGSSSAAAAAAPLAALVQLQARQLAALSGLARAGMDPSQLAWHGLCGEGSKASTKSAQMLQAQSYLPVGGAVQPPAVPTGPWPAAGFEDQVGLAMDPRWQRGWLPTSMSMPVPTSSDILPHRGPTVAQQCVDAVARLGLAFSPVQLMQAGLSRQSMGSMIRSMVDDDLEAVFAEELGAEFMAKAAKRGPAASLPKLDPFDQRPAAFFASCM